VFLYAFDLIELNGDDLRREPLEVRKDTLASVLAKAAPGLRLNEHIEADGPTVFAERNRDFSFTSRPIFLPAQESESDRSGAMDCNLRLWYCRR
jgi:hypothetical protein